MRLRYFLDCFLHDCTISFVSIEILSSSAVLNQGIETWVRGQTHILGGKACVALQSFHFVLSFMGTHYFCGKGDIVKAYSFAMFGMALLVREGASWLTTGIFLVDIFVGFQSRSGGRGDDNIAIGRSGLRQICMRENIA